MGQHGRSYGFVSQNTMPVTLTWMDAFAVVAAALFGCLLLAFQRVYLHPLTGFPGPKLAAATFWYRTYYEVWKDGALVEHLEELHKQYGEQHPFLHASSNEHDPPRQAP